MFYESKITLKDESDQNSYHQLKRLIYVEFLEAVIRLAFLKFDNSEMDNVKSCRKVYFLMEDLCAIVGEVRKEEDNDNLENQFDDSEPSGDEARPVDQNKAKESKLGVQDLWWF